MHNIELALHLLTNYKLFITFHYDRLTHAYSYNKHEIINKGMQSKCLLNGVLLSILTNNDDPGVYLPNAAFHLYLFGRISSESQLFAKITVYRSIGQQPTRT